MLQLWLVDCVAVGHETDPVSNNGPRMLLLDLTHEILCRLFLVGFRKREKAEGTACTIWYLVPLHDESDNSFVSRKPSLFFCWKSFCFYDLFPCLAASISCKEKKKFPVFVFVPSGGQRAFVRGISRVPVHLVRIDSIKECRTIWRQRTHTHKKEEGEIDRCFLLFLYNSRRLCAYDQISAVTDR